MSTETDLEPGDPLSFTAEIEFTCPFCRKHAELGRDKEGRQGVLHTLPYCDKFEALDPPEYLSAVLAAHKN